MMRISLRTLYENKVQTCCGKWMLGEFIDVAGIQVN